MLSFAIKCGIVYILCIKGVSIRAQAKQPGDCIVEIC